ncbi:transglycosylase SLT domain-containing protein [bacterium]|nr:transglycosylase SLT domain-containing protein [bacterium]
MKYRILSILFLLTSCTATSRESLTSALGITSTATHNALTPAEEQKTVSLPEINCANNERGIIVCEFDSLRPHIESVAKTHGLNPQIIEAIVRKESGGNPKAIRRHGFLKSKFKHLNANDRKLADASLGLGQILYGFHKTNCELTKPEDLFDPKTNLTCLAKVLSDCYARAKRTTNATNTDRSALKCYNGSYAYADSILQAIR